jgi:hypothetical protein
MIKWSFLFFLFISPILNAQELWRLPENVQSRVSSFENINGPKGEGGKTNKGSKGNAFSSLKALESKTLLDIKTSGIIQRMWFTINDRSPAMLRALRLRIYWDDSRHPAVDVPFGDFFCAALGNLVTFESALFSNPEGRSFNCYIPMPFKAAAKLTLTNESKTDLELLFFDIDYTIQPFQKDALYFHASWNNKKYPVGQDVELLPKVKGKGRFLGVSVGVNVDSVYKNTWWGEGEVKMYLDGDSTYPTINGTGAEDYIGTGWFEGFFAHQYQGCLVADRKTGQYSFYRFHIPDAIWFQKDCRVTIQQIGGWFAPEVKALLQQGVPLQPISLYSNYKFRGLFEKDINAEKELENATKEDWMNFYRSDNYAVTAYYYLDKP